MKNGGRNGMKNGGRKCIRHGVLKRRAGFAVSDTLSTPTDGQKKKGKTLNPKTGKILVQKRGKFSYSHGRGRRGCQLHTADHPSQSSVARLAAQARARKLCDPGSQPGGQRPPRLPAAHGGPSESVVTEWRGRQLAPVYHTTRDSTRAGRGRWGCQLHTAGYPSQSSVARLVARARQLCDPG